MNAVVLGAGLGLRSQHIQEILSQSPSIPWFEVLADNYVHRGTEAHRSLEAIRERYPIVFHSVGMNLGSNDALDGAFLKRLSELIEIYEPEWISDHLCWVGVGGQHSNDLLPLPYTKEALNHVVDRIEAVQHSLGRPIVVENISHYVRFHGAEYSEGEFLRDVTQRSGCGLLLDVNNLYVNSKNFGYDPIETLASIPRDVVKQIHLAGFEMMDGFLFDTHGRRVSSDVWNLYQAALGTFGPVPTLIEWDRDVPGLDVLLREADTAQNLMDEVCCEFTGNPKRDDGSALRATV